MNHHSRSELFLMELLLSLFILSIAAAACIQVFSSATVCRIRAGEWNHIRELTINVGELLKGLPADPEVFSNQLSGGIQEGDLLIYTYDRSWQPCSEGSEQYRMELNFLAPDQLLIRFTKSPGDELYSQTLIRSDLHTVGEVEP